MLRNWLLPVGIMGLSAGATISANADTPAEAKAAIAAQYAREATAGSRKDIKAILALYTPDYQDADKAGKVSGRDEVAAQMTDTFQKAKSFRLNTRIRRIAIKGSEALVDTRAHLTVVMMVENKWHTLAADQLTRDTWIKSGKTWLKRRSYTVSEANSMDGKPFGNQ